MLYIAAFSTHPIQYQAPLWRGISKAREWKFKVFYFSDQGVGTGEDPDFGQTINWDTRVLEGYEYEFLSKEPIHRDTRFRIQNLDRVFKSRRIDVVLLHGYTHAFARQIIQHKDRYGYKVVLRGEFTDMQRRGNALKKLARSIYQKWFYRHIDQFCSIGKDSTEHLIRAGVVPKSISFSPYSVDGSVFEEQKSRLTKSECRRKLGIPENNRVFLFSGKLIERKQPLLLAEACVALAKSYKDISAIFLGSGNQHDNLCSVLNGSPDLHYLTPGFVNQSKLAEYFVASDIFVLPSTYDTWGLVVNEAMHFGLPCIVSDRVGSGRDLVVPGETGEVFPYDSEIQLIACMRRYIVNPMLANIQGGKAYEQIQQYTIAKTVSGIIDAIDKSQAMCE